MCKHYSGIFHIILKYHKIPYCPGFSMALESMLIFQEKYESCRIIQGKATLHHFLWLLQSLKLIPVETCNPLQETELSLALCYFYN